MPRWLRVFLCGTHDDLSAERDAVLDAIRLLQVPHGSMEFFGARTTEAIETSLAEVHKSDLLVVVAAFRYGSIVPKLGISYSQAEYQHGHGLGKPCLVYFRDENAPILPRHVERDPEKLRLLENWKRILTARHTVARYSDPHNLALRVVTDLTRALEDLKKMVQQPGRSSNTRPQDAVAAISSIAAAEIERGVEPAILLTAVRKAITNVRTGDTNRSPKVLLSYSLADEQLVQDVARRLTGAGLEIMHDQAQIPGGDHLWSTMHKLLASVDFVALFLSQRSVRHEWIHQELNEAAYRQFTNETRPVIFPILLDEVEIPSLLRNIVCLDARGAGAPVLAEQILKAVRRL
jgi:hypothetical protein